MSNVNMNLKSKLIYDGGKTRIYKGNIDLISSLSIYNFLLFKLNIFLAEKNIIKHEITNNIPNYDTKVILYDNYFYNIKNFLNITQGNDNKLEHVDFIDRTFKLDDIATFYNTKYFLYKELQFIKNIIKIPNFIEYIIINNNVNSKTISIIKDNSKSGFNFDESKKDIIYEIIDKTYNEIFTKVYIEKIQNINVEEIIKNNINNQIELVNKDIIFDIKNMYLLFI